MNASVLPTEHLTVSTRRPPCHCSLIDIQMYACTSSKFDHPYRVEGITGVKVCWRKWQSPTYTKHARVHCGEKLQAWKLQMANPRAFEALSRKRQTENAFGKNPRTPHQRNLAQLSWGIQISSSLSPKRPRRDGGRETGPVRKSVLQAENVADFAMAGKGRQSKHGGGTPLGLALLFHSDLFLMPRTRRQQKECIIIDSWIIHEGLIWIRRRIWETHMCGGLGNFSFTVFDLVLSLPIGKKYFCEQPFIFTWLRIGTV